MVTMVSQYSYTKLQIHDKREFLFLHFPSATHILYLNIQIMN